MPNVSEQAHAFLEEFEREFPEDKLPQELRQWVYDYAKKAAARLDAVDTVHCKMAKLAQIVYFNAVNGHEYGDPAENPRLRDLLRDLKNCYRTAVHDAVTQEQLDQILDEAMARRLP
jgi:hypothetical protein